MGKTKRYNSETSEKVTMPSAEQIHLRLLLMMKELHRICVENNIVYYIIGGTALGAMRHHGFIPWDDDVDIGMPRPDYERFSKLAQEKFPEFLERRWYKNTENSPFQFIKLVDNRTTLKECSYENYIEGLYIDIFPLDGAKQDGLFEQLRRKKIWSLHTMVMVNRATKKRKNPFKRIIALYIKSLDLDKLHDKLEKLLTKTPYETCDMTANFLGAWGKREIMEKRLFGTPVLYTFEDTSFYGPEKMDEYLTNLYGDYMTPPPPEEQVFRHAYPLLDFNTPFRTYEEEQKSINKERKR